MPPSRLSDTSGPSSRAAVQPLQIPSEPSSPLHSQGPSAQFQSSVNVQPPPSFTQLNRSPNSRKLQSKHQREATLFVSLPLRADDKWETSIGGTIASKELEHMLATRLVASSAASALGGTQDTNARSTQRVLEDFFFTYTGFRGWTEFLQLQKSGAALASSVKQGAAFSHEAVRPAVPEELKAWVSTRMPLWREDTIEKIGPQSFRSSGKSRYGASNGDSQGASGRAAVAAALSARGERAVGDFQSGWSSETDEGSRVQLEDIDDDDDEQPLLLPVLEDLPPLVRCDSAALEAIRRKLNLYLVHVVRLVLLMEYLAPHWGRLAQRDRRKLQEALADERRSRVSEQCILDCLGELTYVKERIDSCGPELARCSNVRVLRLSNNPKLAVLPTLPPLCHTVVAGSCGLHTITATSHSLTVLALSFNHLPSIGFIELLPALRALDVSHNYIVNITDAIASCAAHSSLDELHLIGNPIALLDQYRRRITSGCPRLESLDGHLIQIAERQLPTLEVVEVAAAAGLVSPGRQKGAGRQIHGRSGGNTTGGAAAQRRGLPRSISPAISSVVDNASTVTADVAQLRRRLESTVAAAIEVLSIKGMSTLAHTTVAMNSEEDIRPTSAFMLRAAGGHISTPAPDSPTRDSRLTRNSSAGSLPPTTGACAASGGAGGKRQPSKVSQRVPLYECRSSLFIQGVWGEEEAPRSELSFQHQPSSERSNVPAAAHEGLNQVATSPSPNIESSRRQRCGVEVCIRDLEFLMPPPNQVVVKVAGGSAAAAAARLRKATAAAASVVVDDVLHPIGEGVFAAELSLTERLAECLRTPFRLYFRIEDTYSFRSSVFIRKQLDGAVTPGPTGGLSGAAAGGSGGRQAGRGAAVNSNAAAKAAVGGDPVRTQTPLDVQSAETAVTHTYALGSVLIDPSALILQDNYGLLAASAEPPLSFTPAGAAAAMNLPQVGSGATSHSTGLNMTHFPVKGSNSTDNNASSATIAARIWLPTRRTLYYRQQPLQLSPADYIREEYAVFEAQKEVRAAFAAHAAALEIFEENVRLEERAQQQQLQASGSGFGSAGVVAGGISAFAVSSKGGTMVEGSSKMCGSPHSPSSRRRSGVQRRMTPKLTRTLNQLQTDVYECHGRLIDSAISAVVLQERLAELRAAQLKVDVKLSVGRGPAPPLPADELQLQLAEKSLTGGKGGNAKKGGKVKTAAFLS